MKPGRMLVSIILFIAAFGYGAAQTQEHKADVPKYDPTHEVTLKGSVTDITERNCPVSGGVGFHFILKTQDGKNIEVHVATSKFVKSNDMALNKGDTVEVVGSKVKFEDKETIFARQITRGEEVFVFRFNDGSPAW